MKDREKEETLACIRDMDNILLEIAGLVSDIEAGHTLTVAQQLKVLKWVVVLSEIHRAELIRNI